MLPLYLQVNQKSDYDMIIYMGILVIEAGFHSAVGIMSDCRSSGCKFKSQLGVVGWCEGAVYLTSLGRPTDIGLQLGKACYPCSG